MLTRMQHKLHLGSSYNLKEVIRENGSRFDSAAS